MAEIYNNKISLAFDIYGCPQRCKHCWLGHPEHSNMNSDEVIATFLKIKEEQNKKKYYDAEIEYLGLSVREPHYGDDYQDLYKQVDKINGCSLEVQKKFELISLWRLIRDQEYVMWIKERGIKRAQLKVFGLKETNDFFYGRKGAHEELIQGTDILLKNGIIPRWQVYFNKKGIDELEGVLKLIEKLKIKERVRELGEEFNIHGFPYDSSGAGFDNHRFRIEKGDQEKIPELLIEKPKEINGDDYCLKTEGELIEELLEKGEFTVAPEKHWLWFYVSSNWDVYPNFMGIAPWWKLGNLKKDPWEMILENYKKNRNTALQVLTEVSARELAEKNGHINSEKLYTGKGQFLEYLLEKHCREKHIGVSP